MTLRKTRKRPRRFTEVDDIPVGRKTGSLPALTACSASLSKVFEGLFNGADLEQRTTAKKFRTIRPPGSPSLIVQFQDHEGYFWCDCDAPYGNIHYHHCRVSTQPANVHISSTLTLPLLPEISVNREVCWRCRLLLLLPFDSAKSIRRFSSPPRQPSYRGSAECRTRPKVPVSVHPMRRMSLAPLFKRAT